MRRLSLCIAAVCLTFLGSAAMAFVPVPTGVVVDDFAAGGNFTLGLDGQFGTFSPPLVYTQTRTDATGTHIIGGSSLVTLNKIASDPYSTFLVFSDGTITYKYGAYNSAANSRATWWMEYGLTSLNANLLSQSALKMHVLNGDPTAGPRPVPVTVTLTSGRGTAGEVTRTWTQDLTANGDYLFPFASFPGVNFGDVDYIKFAFDMSGPSTAAVDFSVDNIQAVPEPGGIVALTIGLTGLIGLRRRR